MLYYKIEDGHIQALLQIIDSTQFKGSEAEEVIKLKQSLMKGYEPEEIDFGPCEG